MGWRRVTGSALAALLAAQPLLAQSAAVAIARGDVAWARRAEGSVEGVPRPEPVREAIGAYEEAVAADRADLTARWRLQRALYFEAEYVLADAAARLETFHRGRELGEEGLDVMAAAVGGRERLDALTPAETAAALTDRAVAAEVYFWTAAHWGLWGRARGKLAAAREGVATKVRDYATMSIALDETIENGGGHRILGRLHHEAPRIPFITGWVSQETAVRELERARQLAPGDLLTQVYLAEALWAADDSQRPAALALLRAVAATEVAGEFLVEDTRAVGDAARLLDELED